MLFHKPPRSISGLELYYDSMLWYITLCNFNQMYVWCPLKQIDLWLNQFNCLYYFKITDGWTEHLHILMYDLYFWPNFVQTQSHYTLLWNFTIQGCDLIMVISSFIWWLMHHKKSFDPNIANIKQNPLPTGENHSLVSGIT